MHTTREELLEMLFSIGSTLRLYSEHKLDNLLDGEGEGVGDIWGNGLGARQSPAGSDVSRRGQYWDLLPGNQ
jgi:hypothetical protein